MVHRSRRRHGGGVESLYLICAEPMFLEPQRQFHHILICGARVCSNKIGNEVLLLSCFFGEAFEHFGEAVVAADAWFHHL